MSGLLRRYPWHELATLTPARVALGRVGDSLPTEAVLAFDVARALARDAVHTPLDFAQFASRLANVGHAPVLQVRSRCADRQVYLQRPDLGRRLAADSLPILRTHAASYDLVVIIADGLSAIAVERHALTLLTSLLPRLEGLSIGPTVLAEQGRVALGDEIGALLGATLGLILLGERPGLTAPDSLGAYLTHSPRVGCIDAQRNCVSNIRPQGLQPKEAAERLAWLIKAALARGLTGIGLRDESRCGATPTTVLLP